MNWDFLWSKYCVSLLYLSTKEIFIMKEKKSMMQTLTWQPVKNHITELHDKVCFIYLTFI